MTASVSASRLCLGFPRLHGCLHSTFLEWFLVCLVSWYALPQLLASTACFRALKIAAWIALAYFPPRLVQGVSSCIYCLQASLRIHPPCACSVLLLFPSQQISNEFQGVWLGVITKHMFILMHS